MWEICCYMYKSLRVSVLLYGSEARMLFRPDAPALEVFEKKILREILDPVRVANNFRIRKNKELFEVLNDVDVVHIVRSCRSD